MLRLLRQVPDRSCSLDTACTNGTLAWQDRATIGFIKQSQIKSMSEQLHNCKITLISVASIATL